MSDFIVNGWYAAAWSYELTEQLLARRLLDIPVVLLRWADGTASAFRDRCPHRFAPLSKGTVSNEQLVCGYHGLRFDRQGECLGSPFNKQMPACRVQRFPVIERYGVIWIWPGDPARAAADAIPRFPGPERPPAPQGYLRVKANYQIVIDNLMDLSHVEFVHLRTFGGAGAFFSGQHSVESVSPTEIWSRWWMPNVEPPTLARARFGNQRINHWQDMRWSAPSSLLFDLGLVPLGVTRETAPSRPQQMHLLTPESVATTHYFYSRDTGQPTGPVDLLRVASKKRMSR